MADDYITLLEREDALRDKLDIASWHTILKSHPLPKVEYAGELGRAEALAAAALDHLGSALDGLKRRPSPSHALIVRAQNCVREIVERAESRTAASCAVHAARVRASEARITEIGASAEA